jgi:hypothetical protein
VVTLEKLAAVNFYSYSRSAIPSLRASFDKLAQDEGEAIQRDPSVIGDR